MVFFNSQKHDKKRFTKKLDKFSIISTNINHINGSLMQHLEGTYFLLKSWGANESLYLPGLYHALYGTSGFANHLIDVHNRCLAKFILGETIEKDNLHILRLRSRLFLAANWCCSISCVS